jgi:hypothetical protein
MASTFLYSCLLVVAATDHIGLLVRHPKVSMDRFDKRLRRHQPSSLGQSLVCLPLEFDRILASQTRPRTRRSETDRVTPR